MRLLAHSAHEKRKQSSNSIPRYNVQFHKRCAALACLRQGFRCLDLHPGRRVVPAADNQQYLQMEHTLVQNSRLAYTFLCCSSLMVLYSC